MKSQAIAEIPDSAVALARLVRQVRAAIEKTAGHMLIDLITYDEDEGEITEMIRAALEWGTEEQAVKHALEKLFCRHEDVMKDASQECARSALRSAIKSLPNAQVEPPTRKER